MEQPKLENSEVELYDLRKYGIEECPAVERVESSCSTCHAKQHTHDNCIELCFLEQGVRVYVDETQTCVLRGGTVWSNLPEIPHTCMGRPSGPAIFSSMRLLPPVEGKIWCGLESEQAQRSWELLKSLEPSRSVRAKEVMAPCFRFLFNQLRSRRSQLTNLAVRLAFNTLVNTLISNAVAPAAAKPATETVLKIIDTINHTDPRVALEVNDLVKEAGITASYFVSSFQNVMGTTPGQYIHSRRMEAAAIEVAKGTRIAKISSEFHFASTQHFTSSFRKYFLITPHRYYLRAKNQQKA